MVLSQVAESVRALFKFWVTVKVSSVDLGLLSGCFCIGSPESASRAWVDFV